MGRLFRGRNLNGAELVSGGSNDAGGALGIQCPLLFQHSVNVFFLEPPQI